MKARVRAVPANGEANDALVRLVAKALGVPPSRVKVAAGPRARMKTLEIEGPPDMLAAAARKALGRTDRQPLRKGRRHAIWRPSA